MLKNNKLNLLISIVCAIVLWAYITTVVNPPIERTINSIPVELINIDALNDRGFTTAEGALHTVDVTVSGPRAEVARLQTSDFRATADMTGYRKGTQSVPISVSLPQDIELVQNRPETIKVEVVDLIAVFKPVVLEFEDEFVANQEPGFIQIIPEEMEVSGAASLVDSVDYIRAYVRKDVLTEEPTSFRVDAYAIDKEGNTLHNVRLSQNSVEIRGRLCYTKVVPLIVETIGEPSEGIEVTDMFIPSYVVIRGSTADIEEITTIQGLRVDLGTITTTVETPISDIVLLPPNIELAEASKELSVRIEVQGIARKEFTFTADIIELRNLAPQLSGHVNTGSVVAAVLAYREVLDEISTDDIRIFVDCSEILRPVSAFEMVIEVECDVNVTSIEIVPEKVRITVIRE